MSARLPPKSRLLVILFFAVLAIGTVFRFSHLDSKFYFGDEVVSSLRESGHSERDFAKLFDGRVHALPEITGYLSDRATSPMDTYRSLAAEDPQHPPLYYVLARYWSQGFGDTMIARRSLAAMFGVLSIAAVSWLGYELFGSVAIGLLAGLLVAISPFQVIYSQQNREYSAWLLLIALPAALLLRASKTGQRRWWVAYAIALAAALWTDVLVILNVASLGLYLILSERRISETVRRFIYATIASFVLYLPWLYVLYRGTGTITGWMGPLKVAVSPQIYLAKWLFNTSAVFFDLQYQYSSLMIVAALVLIIVAAAVIGLARYAPFRPRLFVFLLAGLPALTFVGADLLSHTSRATAPRYLIPVWLGCELAVAWFLVYSLRANSSRLVRISGAFATAIIVAGGIGSTLIDLPLRATSATAQMISLGAQSQAINAAPQPLVVYVHDGMHWDISVAMLATVLRPDTRFQLFDHVGNVHIENPDSGFFLYAAVNDTRSLIAQRTGGRWLAVSSPIFGSDFVLSLRTKARQDRSTKVVQANGDFGLWQREPN